MAVWVKCTDATFRLRSWPILRCAVALSIATAILIPVGLDLLSDQRHAVAFRVLLAILVPVAGAVVAPWTSLTLDAAERRFTWRRWRFPGQSLIAIDLGDVTDVALARRPSLACISHIQLIIHSRQGDISLPLGWTWSASLPPHFSSACLAVQAKLNLGVDPAALEQGQRRMYQVSLRRLLAATALVAIVLAVAKLRFWSAPHAEAPATCLAAIISGATAVVYRRGSDVAERFLLAPIAMYGPLAWIVFEQWPFGRSSGIYDGALMFPAIWTALLPFVHGPDEIIWPAAACVLLELAISLDFARRGWKWMIPWTLLLFVISAVVSFGLNAAVRA